MAADDADSTITREQPLDPDVGGGSGRVFTGRAQPVLLPDLELTLIEEADDPTEVRRWLGPVDTRVDGVSTEDRPHRTPAARLAHGAVVLGLAVVAMLVMAVVIALAAR